MAVVCLGAGWFLFTAISAKSAAEEERNTAYNELQGIYQAKVFPNHENIVRVGDDQKLLETWLVTASNLVHKGDLLTDHKTPSGFKQVLQSTVRELSAQPGSVKGKVVAAGFNFGFDKYLGQDSLPVQEHVDRLAGQLSIIERICKELYAANILELKSVTRETFDDVSAAEQQPTRQETPSKRNKSRRRDREESSTPAAVSAAQAGSGYFSKQRFTFEFTARPAAFVEALNKLAAMDQFVVVAETEFHKTADPLAARSAKKIEASGAEAKGAAPTVDPATLSHVDRILTDPELEPPVNVKLDVDVYSFEGV